MAQCCDPACISRIGDNLDADARVLVLPCEHTLCGRCTRKRASEGRGIGECAVPDCRARFRPAEALEAEAAEVKAMQREAMARSRVRQAMPKTLSDFRAATPQEAEAAYAAYCEQAEELVMRLLDRAMAPGQTITVAELAARELKALEASADREVKRAAAAQRQAAESAKAALEEDERAAAEAAQAEAEAERAATARARAKRARELARATGDESLGRDDDEEDAAAAAAASGKRRRLPGLTGAAGVAGGGSASALAGVSSATASAARMRRPAMPWVPPPRPTDRGHAPARTHDARKAEAAAWRGVAGVRSRAEAAGEAAAMASLFVMPPSGQAAPGDRVSMFGGEAARRARGFAAAARAAAAGAP